MACLHCGSARPNTELTPCGHHGLCDHCADQLWKAGGSCPTCFKTLYGYNQLP